MILKSKICCSFLQIFFLQSLRGWDLQLENLLWILFCYIFNGHTSSGRVNESWAARFSVKCETQVQFFVDTNLFHKVDSVTWETIGSTLFGDQRVTEHLLGNSLSSGFIVNKVYTALKASLFEMAESTTTSKDLSLDDHASLNLACHITSFIS